MYLTRSGSSSRSASCAAGSASRSSFRRETVEMRTTFPSCVFSSRFERSTRSSAWSQGTSFRCRVTFPFTSSVAMMLSPLTSASTRSTFWISASLKSREMRWPVKVDSRRTGWAGGGASGTEATCAGGVVQVGDDAERSAVRGDADDRDHVVGEREAGEDGRLGGQRAVQVHHQPRRRGEREVVHVVGRARELDDEAPALAHGFDPDV